MHSTNAHFIDVQTLFLLHDSNETTPAELQQVGVIQESASCGKPQHVGCIGRLGEEGTEGEKQGN